MFRRCASIAALLVAASLGASALHAEEAAKKPSPDTVVAKVEGEPIHYREVIGAFRSLPPDARKRGLDAVYPALLEELVNRKMLTIFGRREKLAEDPAVKAHVKAAEDNIIAQVYLSRLVNKHLTEERVKARYAELVKEKPSEEEIGRAHV